MPEGRVVSIEHLVQMANDIANFFHAESDRAIAIDGVAGHIRRFWDPRMRRQIIAHWRAQGDDGFSELARAGVEKLAAIDKAPA